MTLVADIRQELGALVPALAGRVGAAIDLAELVRTGALPQQSPYAFVVPLGFDAGPADVATGLFRQPMTRGVGVVLFVSAPGDPRAEKALATVDTLEAEILEAICGKSPDDAIGVLSARRGRLVSLAAGTVIYQIDFALTDQLRIAT
jgi:hypothetical protein